MTTYRNNALREVALIFGSQTGFKSATGSITRALEKHSNNLSVVFDFGKVTTPLEQNRGYVIPPVIIKATDAVSLNHEHTILSSTPPPFDTLAAHPEEGWNSRVLPKVKEGEMEGETFS